MTPQNLLDYVKIYQDHVDLGLCARAVEHLESVKWDTHTFYQSANDKFVQYDHELSISYDNIPETDEINQRIWHAIERYVLEDFRDFHEWFNGWDGFTLARFNRYDPTTQMKLHCDHIHSMFDGKRRGIPVLTVLGALNDDYTGGELRMFGDHRIDLPAGAVVVFPSNFMFPHEVTPVESGTRYSYVSWTW